MSILFSCVLAHTQNTAHDNPQKRVGTFKVSSSSNSGSGTIVSSKVDSHVNIMLYSPFGSKIGRLTRFRDSIEIETESIIKKYSLHDSIDPNVLLSSKIGCEDLLLILQGESPSFIPFSLFDNAGFHEISAGKTVTIERNRRKIKFVCYKSNDYTMEFKKHDGSHFKFVKLSTDSKNFFQISYE